MITFLCQRIGNPFFVHLTNWKEKCYALVIVILYKFQACDPLTNQAMPIVENNAVICTFVYIPGYPQPEFRWLRDGEPLGDFTSEHFYKISAVTREDAGDYRCVAHNSAGAIISPKTSFAVACKYFPVVGSVMQH